MDYQLWMYIYAIMFCFECVINDDNSEFSRWILGLVGVAWVIRLAYYGV
jgi:hypothetical protein